MHTERISSRGAFQAKVPRNQFKTNSRINLKAVTPTAAKNSGCRGLLGRVIRKIKKMTRRYGSGIISMKLRIGNCVTNLREKLIRCCANVYKLEEKLDSTIRACQFDVFSTKSSTVFHQGLCKVRTGWRRMADRKMRMIKCGWKIGDDKLCHPRMEKCV